MVISKKVCTFYLSFAPVLGSPTPIILVRNSLNDQLKRKIDW